MLLAESFYGRPAGVEAALSPASYGQATLGLSCASYHFRIGWLISMEKF